MKTIKFYRLKIQGMLLTSLFVLLIAACGGNISENSGSDSNSGERVRPPRMDIHTAVVTGDEDAVRQHLQAGTDINETDPFGGSTPLITAAVFGRTEMAKMLIDAGADINIQNNDGSTALHSAAFFCRSEIVEMLLEKGADRSIRNNFGSTAYESVAGPFSSAKETYTIMESMMGPMGLKLDFEYIESTRPEIAAMLQE